MKCLICGKEIDGPVDDCLHISGITERGEWYEGYVFICTCDPCFQVLKERFYADTKGRKLLFPKTVSN